MNKEQLLITIKNVQDEIDILNSLLKGAGTKEQFDNNWEKMTDLEATLEDLEDDLSYIEERELKLR